MKVTQEVRRGRIPRQEASNHITRKWGVNGMVRISNDLSAAHIVVDLCPDPLVSGIEAPTTGHEWGHADYYQELLDLGINAADALNGADHIWHQEVDAWVRSLPCPFPLWVGQFALDCLWTYKVGKGVSDQEWEEAKALLSASCEDPEALMDYEPEPIPPGDSGGEGEGGVEWVEGDPQEGVPPVPGGEEGNEGGPEGQPGEAPEGEDPRDKEGDPDGGQGGEGDDGEGSPDGQPDDGFKGGQDGYNQDEADKARDAWLLNEGMQYVAQGNAALLKRALIAAGHKAEGPLPIAAEVIFTSAGGSW